ncbi:MAG: 4Fe-4S binding protein [Candidatus Lokiarchaeota archaeon]|nr:4Fe-4S binding protein [Candidatus Lokiarchaeota archaeon]MBD3338842.1 4Fe-4S binding protein [Candidatus Lokiarchaeota archaeon]
MVLYKMGGNSGSNMIDQLDYSRYFPHFNNLVLAGGALLLAFLTGLVAFLLTKQNKMTRSKKMVILSISFIVDGLLFAGFPNVIALEGLTFLFLGLSVLFGRLFCGYICPLGAMQELISMKEFKIDLLNENPKKSKSEYIRMGVFVLFCIIIFVFGFEILFYVNPMNGFQMIWFPFNLILLVPFFILCAIGIASIFEYRPFCRYICPFGALTSLVARISLFKIKHNDACLSCELCEKVCPTGCASQLSKKGECYLCARCTEFCKTKMFIDFRKLSKINQTLTSLSILLKKTDAFQEVIRRKNFDSLIKRISRLFIPCMNSDTYDKFVQALLGKQEFPEASIQNMILRVKALFPELITPTNLEKYKYWVKENKSEWKEHLSPYQQEKTTYGYCLN